MLTDIWEPVSIFICHVQIIEIEDTTLQNVEVGQVFF